MTMRECITNLIATAQSRNRVITVSTIVEELGFNNSGEKLTKRIVDSLCKCHPEIVSTLIRRGKNQVHVYYCDRKRIEGLPPLLMSSTQAETPMLDLND
jgi:hypothetical protein